MTNPLDTLRAQVISRMGAVERTRERAMDRNDMAVAETSKARIDTYRVVLDMIGRVSAGEADEVRQPVCTGPYAGATPAASSTEGGTNMRAAGEKPDPDAATADGSPGNRSDDATVSKRAPAAGLGPKAESHGCGAAAANLQPTDALVDALPFEAWSSHAYMNDNTCFGAFATEAEAREALTKRYREDCHLDAWKYPVIVDRRKHASTTGYPADRVYRAIGSIAAADAQLQTLTTIARDLSIGDQRTLIDLARRLQRKD